MDYLKNHKYDTPSERNRDVQNACTNVCRHYSDDILGCTGECIMGVQALEYAIAKHPTQAKQLYDQYRDLTSEQQRDLANKAKEILNDNSPSSRCTKRCKDSGYTSGSMLEGCYDSCMETREHFTPSFTPSDIPIQVKQQIKANCSTSCSLGNERRSPKFKRCVDACTIEFEAKYEGYRPYNPFYSDSLIKAE